MTNNRIKEAEELKRDANTIIELLKGETPEQRGQWDNAKKSLEEISFKVLDHLAACEKREGEMEKLLYILRDNQQAQIAGYYNHDKTDEERKIRNAVIEEYRDLIMIFKHRIEQFKTHNHDQQ